MHVVLGIAGNTGSAAAAALLATGHPVRALVRNVDRAAGWRDQGVELVQGEMTDADALTRVFDGAAGAYALTPPDPQHRDPIGHYRDVAEAIRKAVTATGLKRLIFLSSEGAHLPAGTGPILGAHYAEAVLAGAAATTTFLRPSFFQENWRPVFAVAREQGVLPSTLLPLDTPRPQVATADIGETAAALLTDEAPPAIVELSGPAPYSAADAAAAMARALGREVAPVPVPREGWAAMLAGAGLGPAYARLLCEMYDGINSGHVRFSGDGETRTGRRTLDETVRGWLN